MSGLSQGPSWFPSCLPRRWDGTFSSAVSHLPANSLAGGLVPGVSDLKQAFPVGDNLSGPGRRFHGPHFLGALGDEQKAAVSKIWAIHRLNGVKRPDDGGRVRLLPYVQANQ